MKKEKIISLTGIGVFLLYFIYNELILYPFELLGIDYTSIPNSVKVFYLLTSEFVFISILYFIYRKKFIKDLIDYKNHFKEYSKKYIDYWAVAFSLMLISNLLIITYFPNSVANNQQSIIELFKNNTFYTIISVVIFAPLVEETVFRLSFRNMFKSDWLCIILSGLVFGSLHVIGSFNTWIDLIYIIPYSIPGFIFAYTLVKSKNIFVPISLHLFHNTLMILLQVVLLFI